MSIRSERREFLTHLDTEIERLQGAFDRLVAESTRDNDIETLARAERAKKLVAEKGTTLDTLLEETSNLDDDAWTGRRDDVEAAWREYREAVERTRLEFERADELA
ncbi:MAG: hypothetical protein RJQ04_19475 [Longimicrobiales bacterium]